MLRERSTLIANLHRFLDISLTVTAFVSAYFIKRYLLPKSLRGLMTEPNYYEVLLLIIIIWYLCFAYFKLYESYRKQALAMVLLQVLKAVMAGMILMILMLYILKIFNISRLLLLIFLLLDLGLLLAVESMVYFILKKYRSKGVNFRNMLIIGSRERARDLIRNINLQPHTGYRVIGCIEVSDADVGRRVEGAMSTSSTRWRTSGRSCSAGSSTRSSSPYHSRFSRIPASTSSLLKSWGCTLPSSLISIWTG